MTKSGKKDWIQIGKKNKTFGKSYLNKHKKYPKWGNDARKEKNIKKAFCYVVDIIP